MRLKRLDTLVNTAINNENEFNQDLLDAQTSLIKRMKGDTKVPPVYLDWQGMRVINPYFVYKFTGEKGVPIEAVQLEIEKKGGEWIWTDWCEFWWDSWKKMPEKEFFRK